MVKDVIAAKVLPEGALSALLAEARAVLPEAHHEQIFSRTAKSLYR